jgi:hypothetical protein
MRRSMHLLCAAAVGLAACGSKDDVTNLANSAANGAANAANTAESTVADAANSAANSAANATSTSGTAGTTSTSGTAGTTNDRVAFRGCPKLLRSRPPGCMAVKDGSIVYDIDSARPRPAPGKLIIAGSGLPGPKRGGSCIVGVRLSEVRWHNTKQKCPSSKK